MDGLEAIKYAGAVVIVLIGSSIAFNIAMKALQHYQKYLSLLP